MEKLRQTLRNALVTRFRIDRAKLDDDTKLFSSGLLDSLSVMDFVCILEEEIGQAVPPTAITLDNFDSIARVAALAGSLLNKEKSA